MRRSELEKLKTVSVRGELYVLIDDVVALAKAKDEEAKATEAEAPSVPRRADDKPGKA
jgi:bifunctional N-acetylglucosamine-1-phosphate-uridyltransferase/glucosamine-1-phosphate-acetyltransferase GlmU-like protein